MELNQALLTQLKNDDQLLDRVKVEDLLLVALGVRPAATVVVPAELPDGPQLGATIDRLFAARYYSGEDPRAGAMGRVMTRARYAMRRAASTPLAYQAGLVRETTDQVLREAPTMKALLDWQQRLGLDSYRGEARPSLQELHVFRQGDQPTLTRVQAVAGRREEIRHRKAPRPRSQAELIFPEEFDPEYVQMAGATLGYPDCCVAAFVADRRQGQVPELRLAGAMAAGRATGQEPDVFAFFVQDFIPCSPHCPQAAALGHLAWNHLADTDPRLADSYRRGLEQNSQRVERYPQLQRERQAALQERLGELGLAGGTPPPPSGQ